MYGSVKNDRILAPESRKCTLGGSDFKSFLGSMPLDLPRGLCGASNPFAAYFYISATYFDSYWKPCLWLSRVVAGGGGPGGSILPHLLKIEASRTDKIPPPPPPPYWSALEPPLSCALFPQGSVQCACRGYKVCSSGARSLHGLGQKSAWNGC